MTNRIVAFSALAILAISLSALVPAVKCQEPQQTPPPGAQQPPLPGAPQGAPPGAAQAAPGTKFSKIAQVLNLSPQQRSQLQPIVQAEAPKIQSIRQDPNLSGKEKAEKLKEVHGETDSLVKSILNPTQYKQWQQIRKVGIAKMKKDGAQ